MGGPIWGADSELGRKMAEIMPWILLLLVVVLLLNKSPKKERRRRLPYRRLEGNLSLSEPTGWRTRRLEDFRAQNRQRLVWGLEPPEALLQKTPPPLSPGDHDRGGEPADGLLQAQDEPLCRVAPSR